jgi:hypothetical protein
MRERGAARVPASLGGIEQGPGRSGGAETPSPKPLLVASESGPHAVILVRDLIQRLEIYFSRRGAEAGRTRCN